MRTRQYSQAEKSRILELYGQNLSSREIAERLNEEFKTNRTAAAVNLQRQTLEGKRSGKRYIKPASGGPPAEQFVSRVAEIVHDDKKKPKDYTLEQMAGAFLSAQQVIEDQSISQHVANVRIPAKVPIGLSFITDVHLGSPATNYGAFFEDIGRIASDPRLYMGKGGDWCDNFMGSFTDASAPAFQLQPPEIQLGFEDNIIKTLGSSIIAMIDGNHDKMPIRKTGISHRALMRRGDSFAYLPEGGLINLTVGEVTYRILWKHSYRYNSSLNEFNPHHRMGQMLAQADIRVLEHLHSPGMETVEELEFDQKHTVVNIKTGTYKEEDNYSMSKWKAGRLGPETVVLFPDRRKIVPFHGADAISDAQIYMAGA